MTSRRCNACGNLFTPWPQAKNQQFCSNPTCQNERRRRKQAKRRQESLAMRESDAQYLKDWAAKNPGYWQKYRAEHATYSDRNRTQQQTRNRARIAKDTALSSNALANAALQVVRGINNELQDLGQEINNYVRAIEERFQKFVSTWPAEAGGLDPTMASADDFFAKLRRLEQDGLPA